MRSRDRNGILIGGYSIYRFSEVLFVDGAPLRRALKVDELDNQSWLQNRETGDVLVGFDPADSLVEMSYRRSAFYGSARQVTIRGLVIEQYASTAQHGAIQGTAYDPDQRIMSTGWQVLDNEIPFNSAGGVRTANAMWLKGNRIYRNGQIGIVSEGTGIVVESNDIVENNTLGYSPGWEAGATKFQLTDLLQVRNNCVRDNLGPGIWTNVRNRNSTIVENWSIRNAGIGIEHKISGRALIERNTVAFDGSPGDTWWYSQILVNGSTDTLVQNSRVESETANAIFVVEDARAIPSRRNVVANNDITFYGSVGVSGFEANPSPIEGLIRKTRFDNNRIRVVQGTTPLRFRIQDQVLSLERAQQRGQEIKSPFEVAASGTFPNLAMRCPSTVGWSGAQK